jgi:hypothetical protein
MQFTIEEIGSTQPFRMGGSSNVTMIYTLAGVDGTVVVRAEGSHNGTIWVNLDENGSTNITVDGTYGFEKSQCNYTFVRFTWVSGTATNIVVTMQKNNG